jgi:hypothetical protein
LAAGFTVGQVANAALIAGDINIVGYRADADDAIAFVTWVDIANGTSVYFTDSGVFSDGTLRDSEDTMSWTSVGTTPAGTVVVISSNNDDADGILDGSDSGTVAGRLNGFSGSGDQVFVGDTAFPDTGDTTAPGSTIAGTLLYGFDFNGAAGWDADTTGTNASALPSALNASLLNMSVAHVDNGQYTGPRTGLTIDQFKDAVANVANWSFDDDGAAFGALNSTDFAPIPEPSSLAMLAFGMLSLYLFGGKRRRS